MKMSKAFYRLMAFAFFAGFVCIPFTGYYDAKRAELEKKNKVLQKELAVLEARNAPMKEKLKTQKKIGIMLAKFKKRLGQEPSAIAELLMDQAELYGLDPLLILAMIKTESDFRRKAVSRKGAVGLMQLRPFTARSLAKETNVRYVNSRNLKNGALNIRLGTHYIAKLIEKFDNLSLALEAYNRGPSRLKRQIRSGKKIRPVYARRVMRSYHRFSMDFSLL
jgi:soluble lytic murein transglycosylase-like protein